jgi:biopolymer transport protein ExbB
MKKLFIIIIALLLSGASPAAAQDVREAARKAESERKEALEKQKLIEEKILNDRAALIAEVEKLEAREKVLEGEVDALVRKIKADEQAHKRLEEQWARQELEFKEISGNVRVVGRDLETILTQSSFSALYPERLETLRPILRKGYFPDIDDISTMTDLYFDEIRRSGQVSLAKGHFVGRDGDDKTGDILMLGKFTAAYRLPTEYGFLRYVPEGQRFFALSALPPRTVGNRLKKYMNGQIETAPIDISGGAALRQVSYKTTFIEHVSAGGPIVYVIGLIALAALYIVIRKMIFLNTVRRNTGKYMTRVNRLAAEGDWAECEAIVQRHKGEHSPVNHVIEAGLNARGEDRETLESILHESILRELPRLERGLSPLAIFGAVAPLLGLLGTVTGMIETFRVITLYGTGDPKLMSGGISEALVTTELGLMVAIPIMLVHVFLSRRVDHIVGEMEEKAVSLTNIIQKDRGRGFKTSNQNQRNGKNNKEKETEAETVS